MIQALEAFLSAAALIAGLVLLALAVVFGPIYLTTVQVEYPYYHFVQDSKMNWIYLGRSVSALRVGRWGGRGAPERTVLRPWDRKVTVVEGVVPPSGARGWPPPPLR